jgi:hypothetical protein
VPKHDAMKISGVVEVYLSAFLTSLRDGKELSASALGHFTVGNQYMLQRAGHPLSSAAVVDILTSCVSFFLGLSRRE